MSERKNWASESSEFVRGVAAATMLALGAASLALSALGYYGLTLTYLASGLWSAVFFALTPLVLKALMVQHRAGLGLLLIGAKFAWLGLLFFGCRWGGLEEAGAATVMVMLAGIGTPLAMLALRGLNAVMRTNLTRMPRMPKTQESPR